MRKGMMLDPRWYQIFALSSLLLYGKLVLALDVSWLQIWLSLCSVLAFQYIGSRLVKLPRVEYKSALISGLSLCLLLRTNALAWCVVAAAITILSKFFIRMDDKHIFNPTNLGLAVLLVLTDGVWVSPGQWGSTAIFAFTITCLGGMVVFRALRSDVALMFIGGYALMLLARAAWLGDPGWIPIHQLESGALLLFTFFMISDPKTTPDSRLGRIIFAVAVAALTYRLRFAWYEPNALIYSLALCSIFVPLIDRILGGSRYRWNTPESRGTSLNFALGEAR